MEFVFMSRFKSFNACDQGDYSQVGATQGRGGVP